MIDLSKVPAPDVVEALKYEDILAAMLAELRRRDPAFSALVESDPAYKILEVAAYRETLLRARINDSARAVMLSSAKGTDLDNAAVFYGIERKVLIPANPKASPPQDEIKESDDDLRRRCLLAFGTLSTAGAENSYLAHALAVPGILDAGVSSTETPGEVLVAILPADPDANHAALVAAVKERLNGEDVRPLTDRVIVQAATPEIYTVKASLYFESGPDASVVMEKARDALDALIITNRRVGRSIPLSAIYAALHQSGVSRVQLHEPKADILISKTQFPSGAAPVLVVGDLPQNEDEAETEE